MFLSVRFWLVPRSVDCPKRRAFFERRSATAHVLGCLCLFSVRVWSLNRFVVPAAGHLASVTGRRHLLCRVMDDLALTLQSNAIAVGHQCS